MNKLVLIIFLILVVIFIIKLTCKNYINNFTNMNFKNDISVLILNYDRPHNLYKSLPQLLTYPIINDIVIAHGHPDYADTSYQHEKITHIMDFENNDLYKAARRFFLSDKLSKDYVLILDDDLIPTEDFVNRSFLECLKTERMVGHSSRGRICNKNGYFTKNLLKKKELALTCCVLVPVKIMKQFVEHPEGFSMYKDWLIKYNGNCEDLAFNLFNIKVLNKPPIILKQGKIIDLDRDNGYSSLSTHYPVRNKFCKIYS
tara:strand:- start:353 stop:1126 length:774 start_codon:yes stop_codon:yes gene_type:complete